MVPLALRYHYLPAAHCDFGGNGDDDDTFGDIIWLSLTRVKVIEH